ncbi:MAG TPA: tetratricopeptide repeat protein [bacterium]|nr:tetratricopeptide repeat protein [bacterium]HOL47336.1 tetratricopeptide repeat protein [bacterium]HPQ17958.1 tetratricopeptide repeat protein [bacterium]
MQKKVQYKIITIITIIFLINYFFISCSKNKDKKSNTTQKNQEQIKTNDTAKDTIAKVEEEIDPNILFQKAEQYYSTNETVLIPENNFLKAIKTYKKVIEVAPNSKLAPDAQYMIAKLTEEYIKYVNRKKRIEIENLAITNEEKSFDNILKYMLPFDEAIKEYLKMAELYPNNFHAPESLLRAAELYTEDYNNNKDFNKAIKLYELLIAKYPNSGYEDFAQYRIGDCYRYLKNYEKAIEEYQKVLDKYPDSQYILEAENKIERLKIQLKISK